MTGDNDHRETAGGEPTAEQVERRANPLHQTVGAKVSSLLVALLVVNVLLLGPEWLLTGRLGPHLVALEGWLVVGVFALLPRRRWSAVLAVVVAALVVAVSTVEFADTVARQSLGRPLNLYLDAALLSSVARLLTGTLGLTAALLIGVATVVALISATGLVARLLTPTEPAGRWAPTRVTGIVLLALFSVGLTSRTPTVLAGRMAMPGVKTVVDQTRHYGRMMHERDRFADEMARAPADYASRAGLLSHLGGRDVVLAFVESYGVSAVDDPRYAPVIRPRLDDLQRRMADRGLALVTGALVAPTQGGQSWFSHGSLFSGLWLDNQLRYDLLLASDRETLIDDFRRAGYRTVALLPANTLAWPEGERLGYDEILARRDIAYRGPSLNWVTMPDQFTWSYLEHTVRRADDERPLFAELGLISSHAPWTPILPVLDNWEAIGDGAVFAPWADAGEPPESLWLDHDRVREHYALAVDYALHVATSYAERYLDEHTLLIIIGDHQPAPLITGDDASRTVPVHVISGDRRLVAPFVDWGFVHGAFRDASREAPRMDQFRTWFVDAFSDPR